MPDAIDRRRLGLWAAGLACAQVAPAEPLPLRYLPPGSGDRFGVYVVQALTEALARMRAGLRLQPVPSLRVTQGRIELEIARPDGSVDLMWGMTSQAREQALTPIRAVLDRGLIGWRVLVVPRSRLAQWRAPVTLDLLRSRRAGQGLQWPDVEILRANGLPVETAVDSKTLYDMLIKGRIDYFPRSVIEVTDELAARADPELALVPNLLLRYPTASYAFVGPRHAHLAPALARTLAAMARGGRLAALFDAHFAQQLAALDLATRSTVQLHNPLLPPDVALSGAD